MLNIVLSFFLSSPRRPAIFISLWREVNYSLYPRLPFPLRVLSPISDNTHALTSPLNPLPLKICCKVIFIDSCLLQNIGFKNKNRWNNILQVPLADMCICPSRPLPEYGDMDSSCGLTDNRSCKLHMRLYDPRCCSTTQTSQPPRLMTSLTFAASPLLLLVLSQLPLTPLMWVHLEEAALAGLPTINGALWLRRRWICPWTTARAPCCQMTFWTHRTTWTSMWMISIRPMNQIHWNSSRMAMSWSGKVAKN